MLDHVGVDHPRGDARIFQMRMHALPVDAGALHDHQLHAEFAQPRRQGPAAPKAAELAAGLLDCPVGLLDHDGDHMQHATVKNANCRCVSGVGAPSPISAAFTAGCVPVGFAVMCQLASHPSALYAV